MKKVLFFLTLLVVTANVFAQTKSPVNNDPEAKKVLATELKLTDAKVIDQTYENFRAETPRNAELTVKGAQNIVDVLEPKNRNLSSYIDNSIQEELTREGFFEKLTQKYKV
jgi:hypothetical protein